MFLRDRIVARALYTDNILNCAGLRKVYNTNKGAKVAVQDLSLNFYKNQISCLLGHNGAGKTTTISILNGLTKITAGDAKIGPHSVKTDMAAIRTKVKKSIEGNLFISNQQF